LLGKIDSIRTPSNQRRDDIDRVLGNGFDKSVAIYARVSSHKQKEDLEDAILFKDIGGGLNFKRKGLEALLGQVLSGNLREVVVCHQDRLARFGVDLIRWMCEQQNCPLVVLSRCDLSPDREMVEDILAIIHVFSCRLYGLGKYKSIIKEDSSLPRNVVGEKMENLDSRN